MSDVQAEPSRLHPRRRPVLNSTLPALSTDSPEVKMHLKKGETFNTPTSAPSSDRDPVLNIRSLPVRSPTSLESLAAAEERMTSILDRLTLEPTDDKHSTGDSDKTAPPMSNSPGPADAESRSLPIPLDEKKTRQANSHESDSGLGTSVSSEEGLFESSTKGIYPDCSF